MSAHVTAWQLDQAYHRGFNGTPVNYTGQPLNAIERAQRRGFEERACLARAYARASTGSF